MKTVHNFKIGDSVIVYRKGNVYYGTMANIREFTSRTLVTVKYTDENDTFYRSYYLNETMIEKDQGVFA